MNRVVCLFLLGMVSCNVVSAREWTDSTGHYKFKGEYVASGDTMVILQRENKDKDLVAIDVDQLSKEDQKYLEERASEASDNPEMRTYTTISGYKVRAAVIRFMRQTVQIYRHRGKVYVNGFQYSKMPGVYRKIVPQVVNHFEDTKLTEDTFTDWVKDLKGKKKSYDCEGVLAELENGDHYAFPFFLLSKEDREALNPGYDEWASVKDDEKSKEEYSMRMRAQAMEHKKKEAERQQFAKLHLMLSGVQAGLTDVWEVTLIPANTRGMARKVIVPGRDSRQAAALAISKFPGYRAGPARQVAGGRF